MAGDAMSNADNTDANVNKEQNINLDEMSKSLADILKKQAALESRIAEKDKTIGVLQKELQDMIKRNNEEHIKLKMRTPAVEKTEGKDEPDPQKGKTIETPDVETVEKRIREEYKSKSLLNKNSLISELASIKSNITSDELREINYLSTLDSDDYDKESRAWIDKIKAQIEEQGKLEKKQKEEEEKDSETRDVINKTSIAPKAPLIIVGDKKVSIEAVSDEYMGLVAKGRVRTPAEEARAIELYHILLDYATKY